MLYEWEDKYHTDRHNFHEYWEQKRRIFLKAKEIICVFIDNLFFKMKSPIILVSPDFKDNQKNFFCSRCIAVG